MSVYLTTWTDSVEQLWPFIVVSLFLLCARSTPRQKYAHKILKNNYFVREAAGI